MLVVGKIYLYICKLEDVFVILEYERYNLFFFDV